MGVARESEYILFSSTCLRKRYVGTRSLKHVPSSKCTCERRLSHSTMHIQPCIFIECCVCVRVCVRVCSAVQCVRMCMWVRVRVFVCVKAESREEARGAEDASDASKSGMAKTHLESKQTRGNARRRKMHPMPTSMAWQKRTIEAITIAVKTIT